MDKKDKKWLYLGIIIFGIVGIYITFFYGNVDKYDSKTRAYKIEPNESYDSESGTIYNPVYYFRVKGEEYECKASGSSKYPNENQKTVYYDSSDPTKCKTEYDKSISKIGGYISLGVAAILLFFALIKVPQSSNKEIDFVQNSKKVEQISLPPEKVEKAHELINKIELIYKRIIIGIVILVLLLFTLLEIGIVFQTIKAKDYIETTARFVEIRDSEYDNYEDYVYVFEDKNGKEQEIIESYYKESSTPESEIKIKYNEKNPQDYYGEGNLMDNTKFLWFIVKIVAIILLTILFFSKKLLSKIHISAG